MHEYKERFRHNENKTENSRRRPYTVPKWQHSSELRGNKDVFRESRAAECRYVDDDTDCRSTFKRITHNYDENCTTSPVDIMRVVEVKAPERDKYLRFTERKVSKYKYDFRRDKANSPERERYLMFKQELECRSSRSDLQEDGCSDISLPNYGNQGREANAQT